MNARRHAARVALLLALASLPRAGAARDIGVITAQLDDSVQLVDLGSLQVLARLAIGGRPAGVAVATQAGRAYVTSPEGRFLSVIDLATRTVAGRLAVGSGPLGVAVHPAGSPVYVADWYEHRVYAIDAQRRTISGSVAVGHSPSGLAITGDGRWLVSADRDDDQLSIIDTATLTVAATVPVGHRPFGVTIAADDRTVYCANVQSNDVSVVDLTRRSRRATVPVGARPYAIALAQGRAFVTNQYDASVSVFDEATLQPLATIAVGDFPEGAAAASDGRSVYVASWDANTVTRIDAGRLQASGTARTANGPRAFGAFVFRAPGD